MLIYTNFTRRLALSNYKQTLNGLPNDLGHIMQHARVVCQAGRGDIQQENIEPVFGDQRFKDGAAFVRRTGNQLIFDHLWRDILGRRRRSTTAEGRLNRVDLLIGQAYAVQHPPR